MPIIVQRNYSNNLLINPTFRSQPTNDRSLITAEDEHRRNVLDSLRFDQIDARRTNIKRAHAKTCEWVQKNQQYLDWLNTDKFDSHGGLLWIKGKPGAGKSTLMNFAFSRARRTLKKKWNIIMSFFFNARGDDLERSTVGLYRSLLLQLFDARPDLEYTLDHIPRVYQWSTDLLESLFEDTIQAMGEASLLCFIDALDECDEKQVRDMLSFLRNASEQAAASSRTRLHICFASRHYPHITIDKGLSLIIERQEEHSQDITSYLDSELHIGQGDLAKKIRSDLQEKASGIFMWVVLVVGILNLEYDHGHIHSLPKKLQKLPSGLNTLFQSILARDKANRRGLRLCIQWVLFARRPLSPRELYFAILSGVEPDRFSSSHFKEVSDEVIRRYILYNSKGLAESTNSKIPTVQFIHESVRDYLIKENGLQQIYPDLGPNFQGQSHNQIKQCCLRYMSEDTVLNSDLPNPLPKTSSSEAAELRRNISTDLPFLEYAIQNVLHHADKAEDNGFAQEDFVTSFPRAVWIDYNNLFEQHQIRRYTKEASLLYILADRNMPALIRSHFPNQPRFAVENERYGAPLLAALATQSEEAVQVLLETQAETEPPESPLHTLCKWRSENKDKTSKYNRNDTFSRRKGVCHYLIEHGDEIVLDFFLAKHDCDGDLNTMLLLASVKGYHTAVQLLLDRGANVEGNGSNVPLCSAAGEGHIAIAKLLLDRGANVEGNGLNVPLCSAAGEGHIAIVKLLLDRGANVECTEQHPGPLYRAACGGNEAVVQFLLNRGADVEGNSRWTPLDGAAYGGHVAVAQILFDRGANVEGNSIWTPLDGAAYGGHVAVAQILLDRGANIDGNGSNTPLYNASWKGHMAIAEMLLDRGANIEGNGKDMTLHGATYGGHVDIIQLLLDRGANIETRERDTRSPLLTMLISRSLDSDLDIVRLLVQHGADIYAKDNYGNTPLSIAERNVAQESSEEDQSNPKVALSRLVLDHAATMCRKKMALGFLLDETAT